MSEDLAHDPRITAIGLFAEAFAGLSCKFAPQIAEHGLAPVEFEALIRLARSAEGQLRMTDLSTQIGLTASGVTRVVDRLERDRLVTRTACPADRRSWYAVITDHGRDRLAEILPGHLDIIDQWFTGRLAADQLDALLNTLRTIRDAVRPGATAGVPAPGGGRALEGRPAGVPAEPAD